MRQNFLCKSKGVFKNPSAPQASRSAFITDQAKNRYIRLVKLWCCLNSIHRTLCLYLFYTSCTYVSAASKNIIHLKIDFTLTEEHKVIRHTAADFAQQQLKPG